MVNTLRGVPPPQIFKAQTSQTQAPTPVSERVTPDILPLPKTESDDERMETKPVIPRPPLHEPNLAQLNTNLEKESRRSTSTPLSAIKKRGRPRKSESAVTKTNGRPTKVSKANRVSNVGAVDKLSRRTMNSLSSAPSNDLLSDVPPAVPIDAYTGLPAAPSRSPSPPPPGINSRYTEADTIFFYKRVAYDLKKNPELTKNACCDILGQKVC